MHYEKDEVSFFSLSFNTDFSTSVVFMRCFVKTITNFMKCLLISIFPFLLLVQHSCMTVFSHITYATCTSEWSLTTADNIISQYLLMAVDHRTAPCAMTKVLLNWITAPCAMTKVLLNWITSIMFRATLSCLNDLVLIHYKHFKLWKLMQLQTNTQIPKYLQFVLDFHLHLLFGCAISVAYKSDNATEFHPGGQTWNT